MADKTIGMEELKAKFVKYNQDLGITNTNIGKLQNALGQEQQKAQQILGAMQSTADLMVSIVGPEETQKIVNEIQNPKQEEKGNGKKD